MVEKQKSVETELRELYLEFEGLLRYDSDDPTAEQAIVRTEIAKILAQK